MACFVVPAAEAIAVAIAACAAKKKEKKFELADAQMKGSSSPAIKKFTLSKKLNLLSALLWGGVLLLAFEHLWHGEISPIPPFLTALENPEQKQIMLHEMATVGTSMCAAVTAFWGIIVCAADIKFKKLTKRTAAKSK